MTIQAKLQIQIDSVCPNHGVSFGRIDDKSTWRIDFKDEATPDQRAAAQGVISSFDLASELLPVGPDNGAALVQSRRDALLKEIDSEIGSMSVDQQTVLRKMLQLIDTEK